MSFEQEDVKTRGELPDAADEARRLARKAGAECLAAALDYLSRGWSALAVCTPDHVGVGTTHQESCKSLGKAPWGRWKQFQTRLATRDELYTKWRDNLELNVGMALGGVTGLIGLDIDEAGGEELLARLSGGDVPPTLQFTSGKGRRLLYRVPEGVLLRPTPKPGGLEIENGELRLLGLGSQTVMPPSRHRDSGRRYAWVLGYGPDEIEPALAPAWVITFMRDDGHKSNGKAHHSGRQLAADGELIPTTKRNSTLTSLAGSMRRRGMGHASIAAALLAENKERCDPPLDEAEVLKIAASVSGYEPHPAASRPINPPPPSGSPSSSSAPVPACGIILADLQDRYPPAFKRGTVLYTLDGRQVRMSEACAAPPFALVEKLAKICPVDAKGERRVDAVPKLYRDWSGSAWVEFLKDVKPETEAPEIAQPAVEQFRTQVASALRRVVTMGREIKVHRRDKDGKVHEEEVVRQEQRSLLQWCEMWAKPGRAWGSIRGYALWARRNAGRCLEVALRKDLFLQVGPPELARLRQRDFSDLCQVYGVGHPDRAGGDRAVVLSAEFVEDLLAEPDQGDGEGVDVDAETRARTREASTASTASTHGPNTRDCVDFPRDEARTGVDAEVDAEVDGGHFQQEGGAEDDSVSQSSVNSKAKEGDLPVIGDSPTAKS